MEWPRKHISIIIPGYRWARFIAEERFLQRTVAYSSVSSYAVSVIFVDESHDDRYLTNLIRLWPWADVLSTLEEQYYAGTCNLGIQYSWLRYQSRYFVLMDCDVVVEPNYLVGLIDLMERIPDAGICQSLTLQLDQPGKVYSSGHVYRKNGEVFPDQTMHSGEKWWQTPSCSMASAILRYEAVKEVGLFDPIFEMYYETADLGTRMREKGWKCYCTADSVVQHEGSIIKGFLPRTAYFVNRNRIIYWAKHDYRMYCRIKKEYQQRISELQKNAAHLSEQQEILLRAFQDGLRISEEIVLGKHRSAPSLAEFRVPFIVHNQGNPM